MTEAEAMPIQDTIGWEVFASEDAQEGPRAFAEKRAARVQGQVTASTGADSAPTHRSSPSSGSGWPRRSAT